MRKINFSPECIAQLEYIFAFDTMHPSSSRVKRIAKHHRLTKAQVTNWFGYRRRKAKKSQVPDDVSQVPDVPDDVSDVLSTILTAEQAEALELEEAAYFAFLELITL